jgi:LSD1 subclass zinc finger protein
MIVEQYAPRLIQWIVQKENPDTFCATVKLCPTVVQNVRVTKPVAKVEKPQQTLLSSPRDGSSPVACAVCQTVALYVEKWLAENTTEQAIIDRLDVFCNELPGVGPECQAIVSIYLPDLIKWIENKEIFLVFCI